MSCSGLGLQSSNPKPNNNPTPHEYTYISNLVFGYIVSMSWNFSSNYMRWTYRSDKTRNNSESVVKYLFFPYQPWLLITWIEFNFFYYIYIYINKFRLNGGVKINGGSTSFLNHHFLTLGCFFIPEAENGGLEPPLSLKPHSREKIFIFIYIYVKIPVFFLS